MRVVLVDNYDSFVYNLAQYIGALGAEPVVVRSDATVATLQELKPDAVVISPGPGRPEDAGCSVDAIRAFAGIVPVFGVCLGHQAIAIAYGGEVVRAAKVMHGKTSQIHHRGDGVFRGLEEPLEATRYHSLVIDPKSLPKELTVTAETDDGVVMGVKHQRFDVEGVQFHPESVLTPAGLQLIKNFLGS
ncbi:MAG: aminodeoxychorismate/anthranilate synthase component II [Actinomycetota bacterium]